MKSAFKYTLILIAISFLVNCEKYEVTSRDYPRVSTLAVDNITEEGATFNAEFKLRGEFEVVNYGFVWSTLENPTIDDSDRVVYAENIQSNTFSQRIETTLKKENIYNVRAFVKTKDYLIYGENIEFYSRGSNGPELLDFSPKIGHVGDTIKLKATSFGRVKNNVKVKINQTYVDIAKFDEKEISIVIPNSHTEEKSKISVDLAFNTSIYNELFTLYKPTINNIYPAAIKFGTEVTIEGENFNPNLNFVSVVFKSANGSLFPAEITSGSENQLKVLVPNGIDTKQCKIDVIMNNNEISHDQILTFIDPVINSFFPLTGKTLSELTIEGENFNPIADKNIVYIDGYPTEVVSSEINKLTVIIPDQFKHIYSNRDVTISVEVLSTQTQATNQFKITDKWFRLNDLPFFCNDTYMWKGLSLNNEGHVLLTREHWKYDPQTNKWSELKEFPDQYRFDPGIFSANNKIYLVSGKHKNEVETYYANDFWEYDNSTDSWTKKEDFPGHARSLSASFSIGSNGYIVAGYFPYSTTYGDNYNDDWKFDTTTEKWSNISNYPLSRHLWGVNNFSTTQMGDEVYIGLGHQIENNIYKYSESSNVWTKIIDYPLTSSNEYSQHENGLAFTVDNQVFFGSGTYAEELWKLDGTNWISYESKITVGRNGGFNFVIDNIVYVGGGGYKYLETKQFWSFDISQPD